MLMSLRVKFGGKNLPVMKVKTKPRGFQCAGLVSEQEGKSFPPLPPTGAFFISSLQI